MTDKRNFSRNRNLFAMWRSYVASEPLPQLDRWIAGEMKQHREFGKNDRRFYSDMLFAAVRYGYAVCCRYSERADIKKHEAEKFSELLKGEPSEIIRMLRVIPPDVFFEILTSVMSSLDNPRHEDTASLAARFGIPVFYAAHIQRRAEISGWTAEQTAAFITQHRTRPPLWIRPNYEEKIAEIESDLDKEGFRHERSGGSIALYGEKGIYELASMKQGLFEIQDYASVKIGEHCDVHPGMFVWDACAGGGGKTMQIAAALQGRGAVYASDIRTYKLDELKLRARRAGFGNVRTLPWDGSALPVFPKEVATRGGFHRVLVDAPCSSAGTWRRNPDAKFRMNNAMLEDLTALQLKILTAASETVRTGGYLIYATCSFLVEENEEVIRRFLAHSNYELRESSLHGNPQNDADTTFSAVLCRKS